jgi:AGZA family xanthine/uracil permease-like MFS transporter
MLPSIAQLLLIIMSNANSGLAAAALEPKRVVDELHLSETFVTQAGVFFMLAHGFILTGMLWGAALAFLIDRRIGAAVSALGALSALALFGVIHSVLSSGGIYAPWSPDLLGSRVPYEWAAGYAAMAVLLAGLSRTRAFTESVP